MSYIYPKRIRSILRGENPKIQFGYEHKKNVNSRKIGERWIDNDGNQWEQKDGYISKIPKVDIRMPLFCPKCNGIMGKSAKDEEVYWKFGFCLKCLIKRDIEMVKNGTFNQYEQQYIKSKKIGYYKDIKNEITEYLAQLEKGYIGFVNEKGETEKWSNIDEVKNFWLNELNNINNELIKLEENLNGS